ncbi:MAG TPA: hypothetical protein VJS39_02135 [Gemmatimonadaceae bacterium]|nr:hypothetical protein [Gemmatimonadaceae bacterium]
MMVLSSRRPDASLVEYVESRARSAPTRSLIAHTVLAFAVALTAVSVLPSGRQIIVPFALAYFSYGAWGLLDRARERALAHGQMLAARYLSVLCSIFVGLAVLSGTALLFALSFTLLGSPWIL